jgi:hypothetical protein
MITTLWEKKGGVRRLEGESESFQELIYRNKLVDICWVCVVFFACVCVWVWILLFLADL